MFLWACFQAAFCIDSLLVVESRTLEVFKPCSRMEFVFSQKSFLNDLRVDSLRFSAALGVVYLSLAALETSLKLSCFSMSSWGSRMSPENKGTRGSVAKKVGLDRV